MFDPAKLSAIEPNLIGGAGELLAEFSLHHAGQGAAADHETKFRIELGRTGIEVERTDEHLFAVGHEGLGVKRLRRIMGHPARAPAAAA